MQNFLDRLLAGDLRAFVVLALVALLFFAINKYVQKALRPYQGYIQLVVALIVGLLLYTWITNPARVGVLFGDITDWIVARLEPLLTP